MVSIFDVRPVDLIKAVAEDLKKRKELELPSWAVFVKTGLHKQRPPVNADWWWIRAAAILRTVYKDGPVGVSKLRSKYGGRQNRGRKKHIFVKGSGSITRTIVQQLEAAGLILKKFVKEADKKDKKGKVQIFKGRIISPAGQSLLDKCAKLANVAKSKAEKPKVEREQKAEAPKEEKKVEAKAEKPKKAKKPAKEEKDESAGKSKSAES